MKIVIAGCGKIGKTLIGDLVDEGHDILAIDNDPEVLEEITNIYDIMCICGNCADSDIVREADAASADMYIAVTTSDELNMLSCFIAKKMGAKNTLARIRAPEYNDSSLAFMKEHLELALPLNPERLAAHKVLNILKFPSALKVETFSHSNLEIIEARIKEGSALDGVKLMDIRQKFRAQVLICCVQRGEQAYIPGGDFVLRGGDRIGLTASHTELQKFFKSTGLLQRPVKNVMILGGSRMAYYLAKMLLKIGTSVKIIDSDEKVCEALGDDLPDAVIIHGDGSEQELLLEEGILSADAFVAITGSDETNILVSMFATMNGVKKVISKVNRDEIAPMAEKMGLDSIFSPRKIVSDVVLSYASALQNTMGSNIETLYKLMDDKLEALEFNVRDDAKCVGIPLKDMRIRKNILIIGITRGGEIITPSGGTKILPGDRVVVISASRGLRDISDILEEE